MIEHFCPPTCGCSNAQHSLERALKSWDTIVLSRHLSIATVTRWTKYLRPTKQVATGFIIHNLFQRSWARLMQKTTSASAASSASPSDALILDCKPLRAETLVQR